MHALIQNPDALVWLHLKIVMVRRRFASRTTDSMVTDGRHWAPSELQQVWRIVFSRISLHTTALCIRSISWGRESWKIWSLWRWAGCCMPNYLRSIRLLESFRKVWNWLYSNLYELREHWRGRRSRLSAVPCLCIRSTYCKEGVYSQRYKWPDMMCTKQNIFAGCGKISLN